MWTHYLKIAVRRLRRQPGYTLLNILGLAIGMSGFMLILLFIHHELSYDRYHTNADRIYRVTFQNDAKTPPALSPALRNEFPEVQGYVRLMPTTGTWVMRHEDRVFFESLVYWADASFFDFFTLPLLQGDPNTALQAPSSVVISASTARKYFGDEDPMGRTIIADDGYANLTVTGVMADMPPNTHFSADFVVSLSTRPFTPGYQGEMESWFWTMFYTYIMLPDQYDTKAFEDKLPDFLENHAGDYLRSRGITWRLYLQPVSSIHLSSHLENEPGANSDMAYIYILSAVAGFLLVIACINFMNLTTARAAGCAKEVGIRKVAGADRRLLMQQFLGEALLLSVCATAIAIALVLLVQPVFNDVVGKELSLMDMDSVTLTAGVIGMTLLVGILSGGYPAFFLSAFPPATVLSGALKGGAGRGLLRRVLVTLQFSISIVLIIGTILLFNQMDYVRNKRLGFRSEHVIVIPTITAIQDQYGALKRRIIQYSGVIGVTKASLLPGRLGGRGYLNSIGVRPAERPDEEVKEFQSLFGGFDFIETLGIKILAGRSHSEAFATDRREAVVINETAVRASGWTKPEEAVGQQLDVGNWGRKTIIGVMEDFHLRSLHQQIEPMVLFEGGWTFIAVKVQAESMTQTLGQIKTAWADLLPNVPFSYSFLEDDLDRLYQADERLNRMFGMFALIAILIACLGLFGLTSYTTAQRTKEIGVRKVLGASIPDLILLLSREFVRLVLLANLIAWPVAYFVMQAWLQRFAYRIDIGLDVFVISGILALLIALLTISYQSIRTALANPVDALRYE